MIRRDARERRECLQLADRLLHRASSSHANARERFSECSQRSLCNDREPGVTNGVDRLLVRDHQHFTSHALAAGRVPFDLEPRGRAAALGAIVAVLATTVVRSRSRRAAARVVDAIVATAAILACLAVAMLAVFMRPRSHREQRQSSENSSFTECLDRTTHELHTTERTRRGE